MKFFQRTYYDKATALERAYFDADRGCIELALTRLADIRLEFPRDAILEYAEGTLRIDFIGQGLLAQQQFLLAQSIDPNHIFSAFNSAKYARNLDEYRRQSKHSRHIAPHDEDLRLFDEFDRNLETNCEYFEHLLSSAFTHQQHSMHGDLAAVTEIALQANEWDQNQEFLLRKNRAIALRELDKAAETIRNARTEYYHPQERIALAEALRELELALKLNPHDPKLWNYKSAWMFLMRRFDDAYAAAEQALSIQPTGYLKPLINMALAEFQRGHIEKAKTLVERILQSEAANDPYAKPEVAFAHTFIETCNAPEQSNSEKISFWAEKLLIAANITAEQFKTKWKWKEHNFDLVLALKKRCRSYKSEWHIDYVKMTAELLHDFCPELVLKSLMELGEKHKPESDHYMYAALYIVSQGEGVIVRDACRFLALIILNQPNAKKIRQSYREAVIAPSTIDKRFSALAIRMREELERLHPDFPALIADQAPLQNSEHVYAELVTLSRFNCK